MLLSRISHGTLLRRQRRPHLLMFPSRRYVVSPAVRTGHLEPPLGPRYASRGNTGLSSSSSAARAPESLPQWSRRGGGGHSTVPSISGCQGAPRRSPPSRPLKNAFENAFWLRKVYGVFGKKSHPTTTVYRPRGPTRQSHLSDEGLSVLPYRCKNSAPPRSYAPVPPRLPGIFPTTRGSGASSARRSFQDEAFNMQLPCVDQAVLETGQGPR